MKTISNAQMVRYWRNRVAELESMRPMLRAEALQTAEAEDAAAAECQTRIDEATAQEQLTERGKIGASDSLAARSMRNMSHIQQCRDSVWGESTRRLHHAQRAAAMRSVAESPIGQPLAEALAEARERLSYYESL